MNKNSSCTFTSTEMKDIYSMIAELNKRASAHKDILPQLRALQQQCRDKYNQLTKRKILLRAQDKKMAMLTKDQVSNDDTMRRWLNYKMKVERSTYAHNIATNNFRDMLYKERRLRLDMEELKHELHQILCEKIERRFQETLEKMATTIDLVDLNRSNARYQSVKSYIQTIDVREMADNMLRNGSVEYEYPNIQEIIEATGFLEPLPKGRMTSWRLQEHKMADNDFITPSLQSVDDEMDTGLDRNTNNGRYLRTVGSKHLPGPEFLKLKKDQTFKQKLTVMGGEVAFGWSRKGQFGQKKWGFCDTRLVLRVV
ncbi:uncharacterized protein LOC132556737 [Ylistrum balloti]|uniref:uncharacterized protein LOC132556737 n=1 Tax=Ylistrum balloti TaxID=509963 RepID=UPI002905CDDA|nr:uncharacterized protein LOC132556737 [Ylistrum balloti]